MNKGYTISTSREQVGKSEGTRHLLHNSFTWHPNVRYLQEIMSAFARVLDAK